MTDADEQPGRSLRAVVLVLIPCDRPPDVDDQVRACSDYAVEQGFQVVSQMVVEMCDEPLRRSRVRLLRVGEMLRDGDADAVVLGGVPAPRAQWLFRQLRQWADDGVPLYSVTRGRIQRKDLLDWFVPSDRRSGHVARMAGGMIGRLEAPALADELQPEGMSRLKGTLLDRHAQHGDVVLGDKIVVNGDGNVGKVVSGAVPLAAQDDPLPHDGLFVRRNNAFGTKATLGVVDLIDQGVLIDQELIRFDDFVAASDSDQIPVPAADAAVAVSFGSAAVAGRFKAHEQTTHFVEVALKAARTAPARPPSAAPVPVNFVFVIDTSSSMLGEKLDAIKTAIRELHRQLRDTDVLGIVTFDTQVRTLLRSTPKGRIRSEDLTRLIGDLRAGGGTDLNLGIQYGIDEISRHAEGASDYINCLYLFSDGDPTSGETNWIKIRSNIATRLRGKVTLSCFGFGSDARMRELDALAGLSGGHSTFVTHPDDVRVDLVDDLTRREHLAAINIQLKIDIPSELTIWHLYGHDLITDPAARAAVEEGARAARQRGRDELGVESLPDLIGQETGIRIFAPDLAFGETYWIVLELQVPVGVQSPVLGTATVQYLDTLARDNRRVELVLSESGPIPAETVTAHAVGLWTSEVTFYALDDLYQNDRVTAKTRLTNHIQTLQAAFEWSPVAQFRDDQTTMRKLISLAENLGQPIGRSDDVHSRGGATMFVMNQFGQVRSGYMTTRQLGRR